MYSYDWRYDSARPTGFTIFPGRILQLKTMDSNKDRKFKMALRSQGQLRSTIEVGPRHQAEIPPFDPKYRYPEDMPSRETPLWIPFPDSEETINKMYSEAILRAFPYRHDEDALFCLYRSGNDDKAAAQMLLKGCAPANAPTRTTTQHGPVFFNKQENARFEDGLLKYGTNFHQMRREFFPKLKVGDLVDWYYRWKKTPMQAIFVRKLKAAINNNELRFERR
uniref:ELM2 domain-containing protein n=1 Tax=Steinernema glaseri TaxID=37863 RepID=A0A1I7ZZA6_9BILA